jgi:hypothetical protein
MSSNNGTDCITAQRLAAQALGHFRVEITILTGK